MAAAAGGVVTALAARRGWVAAAAVLSCTAVPAQNAFIEAAQGGASAPQPTVPAATVLRAFLDGCIAQGGDPVRTVDWAINQGGEPIDSSSGDGATLLSQRPGTVLSLPGGQGGLLLAIDFEQRCTVWAERGDGPALRAEFVRALNALAARGARVQPTLERSVERGGAWRLQLQMRLRPAGQAREVDVGAVTTLTAQPAPQVFHVAPAGPPPAGAAAPR
jgi:hypothetical protein